MLIALVKAAREEERLREVCIDGERKRVKLLGATERGDGLCEASGHRERFAYQ